MSPPNISRTSHAPRRKTSSRLTRSRRAWTKGNLHAWRWALVFRGVWSLRKCEASAAPWRRSRTGDTGPFRLRGFRDASGDSELFQDFTAGGVSRVWKRGCEPVCSQTARIRNGVGGRHFLPRAVRRRIIHQTSATARLKRPGTVNKFAMAGPLPKRLQRLFQGMAVESSEKTYSTQRITVNLLPLTSAGTNLI